MLGDIFNNVFYTGIQVVSKTITFKLIFEPAYISVLMKYLINST